MERTLAAPRSRESGPGCARRFAVPPPVAAHVRVVLLLGVGALASGCWFRVRTAGAVTTTPTGGGEVHAVYVATPGGGGAVGSASAERAAAVATSAPATVAWVPGSAAGGDPAASGVALPGSAYETTPTGGSAAAVPGEGSAFASAAAGWTWSAAGGWTRTGVGGATVGSDPGRPALVSSAGSAGVTGALGGSFGVALPVPPRVGASVAATGTGARLSSLVGVGVTVGGCACSIDGQLAALSRLVPLAGADLGAGALSLSDASVSVELAPGHDALGPTGGPTSIAIRVRGGVPPAAPPPLRVHLVIDASTSMRSRWDDVKDAALALGGLLLSEDELQIVV